MERKGWMGKNAGRIIFQVYFISKNKQDSRMFYLSETNLQSCSFSKMKLLTRSRSLEEIAISTILLRERSPFTENIFHDHRFSANGKVNKILAQLQRCQCFQIHSKVISSKKQIRD